MNQEEENGRRHLTPRQIVNRFRKGEYVCESMEDISSAIASSGQTFNSATVPFPDSIIEKILENIGLAKQIYERRKAGLPTDDVTVPDYPQLREFLLDLTRPPLWEVLQSGEDYEGCIKILRDEKLCSKYTLDIRADHCHIVLSMLARKYQPDVERAGLNFYIFDLALAMMFKGGRAATP